MYHFVPGPRQLGVLAVCLAVVLIRPARAGEPVTFELCDALRPEYLKCFDLAPAKRWPFFAWLSPDGSRLFVMTEESILFDVASGTVIARRSERSGHSVAWDPTSTVFATYNPVTVWDGQSCDLVCQLGHDGYNARWVRFMGDHRRLLTEGDGSPLIWDARKGTLLCRFPGLSSPLRYVSEAGNRFVTNEGDIWTRRRPEYWWGIAWLPEFWIALVAGPGLVAMAVRRLRRRSS